MRTKNKRETRKGRNLTLASHPSLTVMRSAPQHCRLLIGGVSRSACTRPWLCCNFITMSFRPFRTIYIFPSFHPSIYECMFCRLSASRLRNIAVCLLFFPLHFAWRHLKNRKNFLLPAVRCLFWNALHADSWTLRWGCHPETHLLYTFGEQ